MKRDQILQLLDGVDDRYLIESACFDPAQGPKERSAKMKTIRIVTLALAAALLLGLGTVAFAAGWIGPRAIVVQEVEEGGVVSLTQPQETPEDLDPAVEDGLASSRAAWAEWQAWKNSDERSPDLPPVFLKPEGAVARSIEDNGDGTFTVYFMGDTDLIEERIATQEELDAYVDAFQGEEGFQSRYDFNYDCRSAEEEQKLEEIAAKYGLRLRGSGTHFYSRETFETIDEWFNAQYGANLHTDTSGPQYLSNEEISSRVAEQCCRGPFFRETPLGFDKFYYFDEGSFAVCWYPIFTQERQVTCYVYNASYGTLFSGNEVGGIAFDLESFAERSHTCPDGTVFTVLESPEQAYFYTYLADSYLCGTIGLGLSESEVDQVLDSVLWTNIGT